MPDQRSVMKEFRFLDEKRAAGGLTPAEEARYAHLRDLIGPEMGAGALRPGFDVDAAAAQLRDSLLPAGLRNRPPPPAPAAEPPADEVLSQEVALESAYAEEPFAPLGPEQEQPDGLFDPASLDSEAAPPATGAGAEGDAAPAWDPNAPYDPAAQAYDPNAPPYAEAPADAGAPPYDAAQGGQAAWDPNAPYDAAAQAYDPNAPPYAEAPAGADTQPYDAAQGAQAAWDPNAPYDAAAQAYDPSAPPYAEAPADAGALPYDAAQGYDPSLQAAAWDPSAPYDPDAPYDPAAEAYDPNASPEAGGQAYPEPPAEAAGVELEAEPASAPSSFADAGSLPPSGWYAEPPPAGGAAAAADAEAGPPPGEDSGVESLLPFDPAAAAAIAPGEVPEGFGEGVGEYDDTAGFSSRYVDAAPADLPQEGSEFQAAQSVASEEREGWQPEAVLEEGFQLASGGSFDAAAEAAAPEWAGGASAPPWAAGSAPAAEEPLDDAFAASADAAFPAAEAEAELVEPLSPGEDLGEGFDPDLPPEAAASGQESVEPLEEPPPALASEPDEFSVDVAEVPAEAGAVPTLDFSRPDFSEGAPSEEEAAFVESATAAAPEAAPLEPSFDVSVEPGSEVPPIDLGETGLDLAAPPVEGAPEASPMVEVVEDDVPTIDGEEILEEIPPEEAAAPDAPALESAPLPAASPEPEPEPVMAVPVAQAPRPIPVAPPPVAAAPPVVAPPPPPLPVPEPSPSETPGEPTLRVPGAHRVVVHTVEGQVKRGVLEDVALDAGALGLVAQPGAAPELVPAEKVKAIFFMLSPGEKAPAPEGKKVRVTFRDGRQVAGFSPDYRDEGVGFFMIPGDTRTNTGRIWVYRSAVRQVSVT